MTHDAEIRELRDEHGYTTGYFSGCKTCAWTGEARERREQAGIDLWRHIQEQETPA